MTDSDLWIVCIIISWSIVKNPQHALDWEVDKLFTYAWSSYKYIHLLRVEAEPQQLLSGATARGVSNSMFAPAANRMKSQTTGICIIFSLVPYSNNAAAEMKNVCNCRASWVLLLHKRVKRKFCYRRKQLPFNKLKTAGNLMPGFKVYHLNPGSYIFYIMCMMSNYLHIYR